MALFLQKIVRNRLIMWKKIFALITILLITVGHKATAQTSVLDIDEELIKKIPPKQFAKYGDLYYRKGDYYLASELYEKALSRDPTRIDVAYKLAMALYKSRDYEKAAKWFKYVKEADPKEYPEASYYYALMLIYQGKYMQAKRALLEFKTKHLNYLKTKNYRKYNFLKKQVEADLKTIAFALKAQKNPLKVDIIHLDSAVNSAYTEMSPLPLSDTELVYASLRADSLIITKKGRTKKIAQAYRIRFYKSHKERGQWFFDGEWNMPWNHSEEHTANGAFNPDKTRFYFTKCLSTDTGYYKCDIYMSEFRDSSWQEPIRLPEPVNHPIYTTTQPTVGILQKGSKKIEVLYFVSDRREQGHRGGLDIWYVYNLGGTWSRPKNLGKTINTPGDEMTPWYDQETQTLYFSSSGHPGMGGLDIFRAKGAANKWAQPQNVGYPINTSTDELYFILNPNRYSGYFVSNRIGIYALKNPTCCDDIWYFEFETKPELIAQIYAYDEADSLRRPLDSVTVYVWLMDSITGRMAQIKTLKTDSPSPIFYKVFPNQQYKFTAERNGYFKQSQWLSTTTKKLRDTFIVAIPLKKLILNKPYTLRNIYYDFDKWDLKPESFPVLDSLAMLLKENPELKVEIRSHTDSRGSDEYNLTLSQKRAESVVKYLVSKGISPERLIAKGYGEKHPIASNDTEEGRAKNRRTEFVIIGKVKINYQDEIFKELDDTRSKQNSPETTNKQNQ